MILTSLVSISFVELYITVLQGTFSVLVLLGNFLPAGGHS